MQSDATFNAETIPPNLRKLMDGIRQAFGLSADAVGAKGDLEHRRGYHRSRQFILESPFSANRTYSVTEPGNRDGDQDWICAVDVTLDHDRLVIVCRRLDHAVRAGRLEKVAEWYGNLGNDNRVDGFDNIVNALSSADPSHLWHVHMSFIRGRANEDHADVLAVLTGMDSDDMDPNTAVPVPANAPFPGYLGERKSLPAGELWHAIYYHVSGIEHSLDKLNQTMGKLTDAVIKLGNPPASGK
jgi:hypothetical protein